MFSRDNDSNIDERPLDIPLRRVEFVVVMSLAALALGWLCVKGCREPKVEEILGRELRDGIQGRRTVFLDMDESLRRTSGGGGGMFGVLTGGPKTTPTFAGAGTAIAGMSGNLNFILISARPESLRASTEQWLEANGVPQLPAILSRAARSSLQGQADCKIETIRSLTGMGFNAWVCLCERPQDAVTYVHEGLICAMIIEGKHDPDLRTILHAGEETGEKPESLSRLFLFDLADFDHPLWERLGAAISGEFKETKPYPALN
ncbi:MAG TPA: hypothetical protein PL033_08650 [Candidatus Brocadiia bacterium]|nr:hypothetical protein [Candidatus Brocadiia bacterium]